MEMACVSKEQLAGRDDTPSKAMSIINDKEKAVIMPMFEAIFLANWWVRVANKPPLKKVGQRPTRALTQDCTKPYSASTSSCYHGKNMQRLDTTPLILP
jgi:hypothetical protein